MDTKKRIEEIEAMKKQLDEQIEELKSMATVQDTEYVRYRKEGRGHWVIRGKSKYSPPGTASYLAYIGEKESIAVATAKRIDNYIKIIVEEKQSEYEADTYVSPPDDENPENENIT